VARAWRGWIEEIEEEGLVSGRIRLRRKLGELSTKLRLLRRESRAAGSSGRLLSVGKVVWQMHEM
jgi:hypothetical protein